MDVSRRIGGEDCRAVIESWKVCSASPHMPPDSVHRAPFPQEPSRNSRIHSRLLQPADRNRPPLSFYFRMISLPVHSVCRQFSSAARILSLFYPSLPILTLNFLKSLQVPKNFLPAASYFFLYLSGISVMTTAQAAPAL